MSCKEYRKICILTKSKKHSAYCVAGIDLDTREWVRLVSPKENETGPLSGEKMPDGLKVLDVFSVPIRYAVPRKHQKENQLVSYHNIDPWRYVKTMTVDDILKYVDEDTSEYIFGNSRNSLLLSEMPEDDISLRLFKVEELTIFVNGRPDKQTPSVKATFIYGGYSYSNFSVTDMEYSQCNADKRINIGNAYIVVSLPLEAFILDSNTEGRYYKFIAQVFPIESTNANETHNDFVNYDDDIPF